MDVTAWRGVTPVSGVPACGIMAVTVRAKDGSRVRSRSRYRMLPESGATRPDIWPSRVVLPAPLWPMSAMTSPGEKVRVMPSFAGVVDPR